MQVSHIRSVLTTTNLVPQPATYLKVLEFLQNHSGIQNNCSDYEALAAFAIVSQIQKIKPVDNSEEVSTGIHLETVMKHLAQYSKETLLQEVIRQCEKWREAPSWLKTKIDSVNIAYRIYKKYRTVFQDLSKDYSHLDDQTQFTLSSIFWVLYLFIKNSSADTNALEATKILQALFKYVFGEVLAQLDQNLISRHFKQQFRESQPLQPHTFSFYKGRFEQKMLHIQQEQRGTELDLIKLVTEQHLMIRFLDDIGNHYERLKLTLPPHSVDQLSFIELEKDLTPLPVKRNFTTALISKKINFEEEDDDEKSDGDESKEDEDRDQEKMDVESNPINFAQSANISKTSAYRIYGISRPVSPFGQFLNPRQQLKGTPISARNQNLVWVNRITQSNQRQNLDQLKIIYQLYSGKDYNVYENHAFHKIFSAIDHFTPACMDFNKRQRSIYSFFAFFIKTVSSKHQEAQKQIIFSNDSYFNAILCLSTNLFNYAYQSLQSSYKLYCQIFGVGVIQGQIPINWFGVNAEMPKNIEIYLYDLQKRILIQQIWDDQAGYKLLSETGNTYQAQAILKRIKKHADERTQELCQAMKIDNKQIAKTINLIRFILEKRQTLLREHNIDQIIVCAITSIVSINRAQTMSLAETFEHYNKLLFSLNISRSIFYNHQGRKIDILDYYNNIFLPQLDQIIQYEQQAANILNTPVRLQLKNRLDRGTQLAFASKFKQFSSETLGKKKIKMDPEDKYREDKYRNRLVNNVLNTDINEKDQQNIEEDIPSPSFGGGNQVLYRTYSFGDIERDKF